VYFTGGQPFRGRELVLAKFFNTQGSQQNVNFPEGKGLIHTESHKSRATTHYFFHVVRFPEKSVATLMALYLIYVHPFAKMICNAIQKDKTVVNCKKKIPYAIQKRAKDELLHKD